MAFVEHIHADAEQLAAACAARVNASLDDALRERGKAVLVLAGGRTAPPIFRRVAAQPRDWSQVTLLPSDERWVAADHPDCNLRQLRDCFVGIDGIRWVSLAPAQPQGEANAAFANGALAPYAQDFDLCMIGMGADGHFASLFPGAPTLAEALALDQPKSALPILPDPMPAAGPHPRISLTLSRLLRSRRLMLVITGADKRAVIEQARGGDDRYPVAHLLRAVHPNAEIHWSP